jgi:hypothetical protein
MIRISTEYARELLAFMEVVEASDEKLKIATDSLLGVIRTSIQGQLDNPRYAEDLLDTVARILGSPKAKVAISGQFVTLLRQAILSPREAAKLSSMAENHQACGRCGNAIGNGEMASLHAQQPFCSTCSMPTTISCGTCRAPISFPDSIYRIVKKVTKECQVCEQKKAPPTSEVTAESQDGYQQARNILDDAIRTRRNQLLNEARQVSGGGRRLGGTTILTEQSTPRGEWATTGRFDVDIPQPPTSTRGGTTFSWDTVSVPPTAFDGDEQ